MSSTTPQPQREKSGRNRTPKGPRANGESTSDSPRGAPAETQQQNRAESPAQNRQSNPNTTEPPLSLQDQQNSRQANDKKRVDNYKQKRDQAQRHSEASPRPSHLQSETNDSREETFREGQDGPQRPRGRFPNRNNNRREHDGDNNNNNYNRQDSYPQQDNSQGSNQNGYGQRPNHRRNNGDDRRDYDRSNNNQNRHTPQQPARSQNQQSAQDPLDYNDVPHWTTDNVAAWLEEVGFEKYVKDFRKHHIHGGNLFQINADHLKTDLGISSLGHRLDLLNEIKALRPSQKPHNNNNNRRE